MKRNALFLILSLFLCMGFVSATCSSGDAVDQSQLVADSATSLNSFLSGTGYFQRSVDAVAQSFVPSATGELSRLEVQGTRGNLYDTSYVKGCYTATGALNTVGGASGVSKIAQRFHIDAYEATLSFATVQIRMAKWMGSSFDHAYLSIQADVAGSPSGANLATATIPSTAFWNTYPAYNTYMSYWSAPPTLTVGDYWLVISVATTPAGIYAVQGENTNCGAVTSKYYDSSWHSTGSPSSIYFQMNPQGSGSNWACVRIYSDSSNTPGTFLESALVTFPATNGWSSFVGWRLSTTCTSGFSSGPTLTSGQKYWMSIVPLGDADILPDVQMAGSYAPGKLMFAFYSNPAWQDLLANDLTFRTYKCASGPITAPTATNPLPNTATVSIPQNFSTTVGAGTNPLSCIGWHWGDGSYADVDTPISAGVLTHNHTYTVATTRTLTIKVCDSTNSTQCPLMTSDSGCTLASTTVTISAGPTVTPTPSPTATPSSPCDGSRYEGQPCTQNCDCHVGLRCNPDTNTCQKLMDKVKTFGFDMFGLAVPLLEVGIAVAIIAALLLLLMGRRDDI